MSCFFVITDNTVDGNIIFVRFQYSFAHDRIPEYDISDEGIMVFCKPNEKYLQLLRKDRLGIDESILSRFRAEEASSVLQIMELIVTNGSINNAEAREATGKSKPTITRLLSKMCTVGLTVSEGSGPAVRYKKSAQIS